jgi:hypothetical protein
VLLKNSPFKSSQAFTIALDLTVPLTPPIQSYSYYLSAMSSGASYYDIDDILAQEELTPVTTLLDFTYLAHLDPDYVHGKSHDNDVKHNAQGESQQQENTSRSPVKKPQNHYLKEGTRFKMPLWSIEKWAQVGFVKMSFPRHYGKKARERLDADPVSVDIRCVESSRLILRCFIFHALFGYASFVTCWYRTVPYILRDTYHTYSTYSIFYKILAHLSRHNSIPFFSQKTK